MKKILTSLLVLVFLLPALVWGQAKQRVVTGIVKDANGPLAGATVTEKGQPANAAAADERWRFRIVLRGGSNTLIVSYLNYQKQEVAVRKEVKEVEVVMQQSAAGMD